MNNVGVHRLPILNLIRSSNAPPWIKFTVSIFFLLVVLLFTLFIIIIIINNNVSSPTPSSSLFSTSRQPPPGNSNTAMYPTFANPKMQKAVGKLVEELNEESRLRKGKKDEKMVRIEAGLGKARALIKDAIFKSRRYSGTDDDHDRDGIGNNDNTDNDYYVPHGQVYRNAYAFRRSYMAMEKMFKIYVYEEGEVPIFHNGPTKEIYSSEGVLIGMLEELESSSDDHHQFRTRDPSEAHAYFLPFSVTMILQHLFDPIVRDKGVLERVVKDYVALLSTKYLYWNRSLGADHFMLACHDWGPRATWYDQHLYFTSMRGLCNANTSEFFNPRKDFPIPELNLKPEILPNPIKPPAAAAAAASSNDTTNIQQQLLAFFAGGIHGHIRGLLFQHWQDKDKSIVVTTQVVAAVVPHSQNSSSLLSYAEMMQHSKYCLCPSGFQVASQRVVEAIYAGCVPVLINEDFVPPFSDVLDWDKFSVKVEVADIPNLKRILEGIGDPEYEALRRGVRQVQSHFLLNHPPLRYDVFHMMLHSLWLRRLNLRIN